MTMKLSTSSIQIQLLIRFSVLKELLHHQTHVNSPFSHFSWLIKNQISVDIDHEPISRSTRLTERGCMQRYRIRQVQENLKV